MEGENRNKNERQLFSTNWKSNFNQNCFQINILNISSKIYCDFNPHILSPQAGVVSQSTKRPITSSFSDTYYGNAFLHVYGTRIAESKIRD